MFELVIFYIMKDAIKIKIAVPSYMRDQLELDIQDYQLKSMGDLCNYIIEFRENLPKSTETKGFTRENNELFKNCDPLQFTLHRHNQNFADYANSKGAKLASLCRHYIEQYISLPRGMREMFLKKVELIKLNRAIENRKNVTLFYKGKIKTVAPCFIAHSPSQVRTYLVVCKNPKECERINDLKENTFKAYRLCHVKNASIEENSEAFHTRTNALLKKAEAFREHFDPFLCYGQELRVKLTEEGVKLLKTAVTNRPKILKVPGEFHKKTAERIECALENNTAGIYTMECSPELAKVYFPQFLETAEILSPAGLRNYFRQRFLKAAQTYGLMDSFGTEGTPPKKLK